MPVNGWEFVLLAVLALVILGPEKLPKYAADAGRLLRTIRTMANDAKREVTQSLGPEFQDIDLADLNPRTFVKKHLFDGEDLDLGLDDDDDDSDRRPYRGSNGSGNGSRPSGSSPSSASSAGTSGASRRSGASPPDFRKAGGAGPAGPAKTAGAARPPYDPDAT